MGGGRPLEVPLASMGISCRGAVIVRAAPRIDKSRSPANASREPRPLPQIRLRRHRGQHEPDNCYRKTRQAHKRPSPYTLGPT